ncbi:hypothetical protein LCGC14_1449170 [marine sediment metagenome]|uniref:HNH nuclease domain-containing protein n=1 Tax=marine sediment metagenome TaxID=412755 RepID=A0A0F9JIB1_9ZZZZ
MPRKPPTRARRETQQVWEANQRSEAAGLPADLTLDEWRSTLVFFEHRCTWCGSKPVDPPLQRRHVLHLDHIIKGGGTTNCNCVPACIRCCGVAQPVAPERLREFLQIVGGTVPIGTVTHYFENGHPLCASDRRDDHHSGTIRTVTCSECLQIYEENKT